MRKERSYGIIPVLFEEEKVSVLLVRHKAGWWGFPKGHPEEGETPVEAASRELQEETNLQVEKILLPEPFLESYRFLHQGEWIDKSVHYFLATTKNPNDIMVDDREVVEGKWTPIKEAEALLTFSEGKAIVKQVTPIILG